MARIFITGSSDGLGAVAARTLLKRGHQVVLHARNAQRAEDAKAAVPGAEGVLVGDLSRFDEAKKLAEEANKLGTFDVVIHNAGLYRGPYRKTDLGLPSLTAVNVFAPYLLTALINKPKRVVYISSGLHRNGDTSFADPTWRERGEAGWNQDQAYFDSKLLITTFANAVARLWPDVKSNSIDPGWVPTKMGGQSATGLADDGIATYVLLAEGTGAGDVTGKYFKPSGQEDSPVPITEDEERQDQLVKLLEQETGVKLPST
ncbi:short-chain dehydrogenase [Colletotrichum higginsianum]|uniref:Short-chain dehydrogenase n=2 Tax=Colletotrichum higginsianum TaxID=80884 RepID=H1V529_COLHI|nr:Short-chain dehydrogenase [Colletotrichum higginsianum IMI 349063]OBR12834.1 Short-chain dehydrogenase [Colletotrichum higginsianum IMI 349063]TIC98861.1 putative oxidoreductase [Colletotrichum higginsianum]GJC94508.1 short-chain dehydrogenase [Colletotrichum higginsianum]CCF35331.1 short-chain dehydrogenase [Colletotrichum higginsianum]